MSRSQPKNLSTSQSSNAMTILSQTLILIFTMQALPLGTIAASNDTDRLALLAFREQATASSVGALTSWNSTLHYCSWEGITCNSGSHPRVTNLSLPAHGLFGSLSPSLGNLTALLEINLQDNNFHGNIPPELSKLIHLRTLNLTSNSLTGEIPANLSNCKRLYYLSFKFNQLVGHIPSQLTSLPELSVLYFQVNNLTGTIPSSIGNLTSLEKLGLGRNGLSGTIPEGIGQLARLVFIQVSENQLSGDIPLSLYNLSSLYFIAIATNQMQGSLPPELGLALPNLENLYAGGNQLTGRIPRSIVNASGFTELDLAYNNFTGSVPTDIGKLSSLDWLDFESNQLGFGDPNGLNFIYSLTNCTNLQLLAIDINGFEGLLPTAIANLSAKLSMLLIDGNQIDGSIPESIGNLAGLTMLRMENNLLNGSVPASIGKLQNLQLLNMFGNNLSGQLPSSIGNLSQLNQLNLQGNAIQGSIPPSLGNCRNLQILDLSTNKFSGAIPAPVISIPSLSIFLSLAHNSLSSPIPLEVGKLKNLNHLDVSDNRLTGVVPKTLGDCESMEYLHMEGNMFQGSIPSSLSKLKAILYVDLSRNNFSGQIPSFLGRLQSLRYLNLSYNDFEGIIPGEGVFKNASALSVLGNRRLCGGITVLQLPTCVIQSSTGKARSQVTRIVIPIVCAVSVLALLLGLFAARYLKRLARQLPSVSASLEESYTKVSYRELLKATNGFSSTNLIGQGGFGTVYRGTFDSKGTVVAIKVLNLHQNHGASKSFLRECEVLRNIRHRNLIKILTICSSVDSKDNEFKALVYEFMPNGSLEEWLHRDVDKKRQLGSLNIIQRLNICIDVTSALDYLHNQYEVPIVHCDLKPSNVLLDDDLTAHVSDFGLAKILLQHKDFQHETGSMGIKGSIGYVPPEYGLGNEVSTLGDVYSYGVLLLEMFTGKRPTDATFSKGSCIHDLVKKFYPERVMELIDPYLLLQDQVLLENNATEDCFNKSDDHIKIQEDQVLLENNATEDCFNKSDDHTKIQECLASVIGIGLACSAASPRERMEIKDAIVKMIHIREIFVGKERIHE